MDRRIVKTQQLMLRAMIALLGKQAWNKINVQQICDEANIARSTFYSHFENKQELFDFGFAKLEAQISGNAKGRGLDENGKFSFLPELLDHIQKHEPIFCGPDSCVADKQSSEMVFGKFRAIVFKFTKAEIQSSKFKNSLTPEDEVFLAGGIYGILDRWWIDRAKLPIPQVLRMIDQRVEKMLVS